MSLTDDWKAGKLPEKNFFIKTTQGILIGYHEDGVFYMSGNKFVLPTEIEEVLAPCDYDHFVELTEKVKQLEETSAKAAEIAQAASDENEQLRQLLEGSIYILNEYKHCFDVKHHNMAANIIDKANEVLK